MQIPQLTFTRFLASISIVILHYGLFSWPMNTQLLAPLGGDLISAMSYFFFLSGFILVISSAKGDNLAERINSKNFWQRRAARILPVYLLALIIYFILNFKYDPSIPLKWQIQSYYHSLFLLQAWKYKMALDVNYPSWSLSVEAFFYFIFPWLYVILRKLSNKKLLTISTLLWILNLYIFIRLKNDGMPDNFIKYFPLLHLATFVIGINFGILLIKNYQWLLKVSRRYIFSATLAIGLFLLYAAFKNFNFLKYQHNGLLVPFYILVVYSLTLIKGKIADFLSSKPFIFLGSISYSVYILQFPVLQICQKYLPWFKGQETKDIFYPYVIVLITISSLVYLYFEKPARLFLKGKQSSISVN